MRQANHSVGQRCFQQHVNNTFFAWHQVAVLKLHNSMLSRCLCLMNLHVPDRFYWQHLKNTWRAKHLTRALWPVLVCDCGYVPKLRSLIGNPHFQFNAPSRCWGIPFPKVLELPPVAGLQVPLHQGRFDQPWHQPAEVLTNYFQMSGKGFGIDHVTAWSSAAVVWSPISLLGHP